MLIVISPAKRLDWSARDVETTEPAFAADALRLAKTMRNLTLGDLRALMDLSDDLARLNRDRFRAYAADPSDEATRPAVFAFAGDTYQGLDAARLDAEDLAWAQDRLRILSGLYGVLRPLDAIQPYRLEMGSRLKTRRGATLYDYWRDGPTRALADQARALGTDTLLNCASQEYFGVIDARALGLRIVTPVFLDEANGTARVVSFHAKRARGAMARHAIENRLCDPSDLEGFAVGGYRFDPERSEPDRPVFLRREAARAAG